MANDNSRYTVLVVDDVPVNVLLVKGMLAKQKFNVISASSGQQALDLIVHERPDCILMDILMPNMNGFETTRAVRANPKTQDIPIINFQPSIPMPTSRRVCRQELTSLSLSHSSATVL